jgi:hypothetical protein
VDRSHPCLRERVLVLAVGLRPVESQLAAGHAPQPDGVELDHQVEVAPGLGDPPAQVMRPGSVQSVGPVERGLRFRPAAVLLQSRRIAEFRLDGITPVRLLHDEPQAPADEHHHE